MITKEDAKKELALRELSRRKLEYFVPYVDPFFWHSYKWYTMKDFHILISQKLQDVLDWKIKKLMISVPPQHWKSTISSQRFPLFAHMKDPLLNLVLASYSQDLSKWHLSKIRQLKDWDRYDKVWKLNTISDTAVSYELKEWWTFTAVWVWWSLTWKPVDWLIIDDVHKDRMEYESTTIRNWVWDWYTSVALSRLHKDSWQVLVMTRWGEDDLFWRILWLEADEWEVLNIPVLKDNTTIFPERFPLDFIQSKRKVMWERDFQSLYMWDPINEWGWDFTRDYIQYYQEHLIPTDLEVVTFIDPAISQKQEADNTAIVTIWLDKRSNNIYILEVLAGKMLPDEIINNTFKTFLKWKPKRIWIEVVAYQKMLAIELRKQMNIRNIFFVLDEIHPQWEKISRIRTILQPRYSNLSIFHNNTCNDLELELLKFPNGKHDDMIDALASAVNMLNTFNISHKPKVFVPNYAWI